MRTRLTFTILILACGLARAADEPPTDWIDPDTGHRIVRLSREPGSASLYFNQNAYTADGKRLLITTPGGLSTINLETRTIEPLVTGKVNVIVAGSRSGQVYYIRDGVICATHVDTKVTREIGKLPARASVATLNADETLLAGAIRDRNTNAPDDPSIASSAMGADAQATSRPTPPILGPDGQPLNKADAKEVRLHNRLARRIQMSLFTMNIATGEIKTFNPCTDWLNHFQFSPTNPSLLMFCHEGPWHEVDRIWTIRTDGTGLTKIHTRTLSMEIAGHEFWSANGDTIWYDLQTPRGEDFWVAGYNVTTGDRVWYHLGRDEWSVHFNVSPDGKLFAGDGGDEEMVAHAKNGKWIYLFHPKLVPDIAGLKPEGQHLIQSGVFESERLVNMSKHDYKLEPNVSFTPDMKWLVFRSNMFGSTQVFAVEVKKSRP